MKIVKLFAAALVTFLLAGCATENTTADSNRKWHPRDGYFQTLDTTSLESQANVGDYEAVFHLAIRLMNGDRIGRDQQRAVEVVRKSAMSGDARSQYLLGAALTGGSGVPKDEYKAVSWFKKSAEQGYVSGEYWHGFMLSRGRGYSAPNWAEALKWFRRAANKGHEDAQAVLGEAHESCRGGLSRDFEKAATWYRRADRSGRGHMMSRYNLRRLIDIGAVEWREGDGGAPPIKLAKIDRSFLDPCD